MLATWTANQALSAERDRHVAEKQMIARDYNALYQQQYAKRQNVSTQTNLPQEFSYEQLYKNETQLKYYTCFTTANFESVYKFLVPSEQDCPIEFPSNRCSEVMRLNLKDQLCLTIMKLRHNFHHNYGSSL